MIPIPVVLGTVLSLTSGLYAKGVIVFATPVMAEPSPLNDVAVTIPEKVAFPFALMVAAVDTLIFPVDVIRSLSAGVEDPFGVV